MMKKIFNFSFLFLVIFIFGSFFINPVFAEDVDPTSTEIIPPIETLPDPAPILEVTFIIRNGDNLIYRGTVPLPDEGSDQSVLGILKTIDESNDSFSISNTQNFSFGAYLKCILPTDGIELCDNWQYAVGSLTPFSSIDTTTLSGGETVGIYFGSSHQLVLSTNSIIDGESMTATAEQYDYQNNIWNPLTGVNIGVTLPNPSDPFNPTVVSTNPVDSLGNATITITDANIYTLGIAEDFYFPPYTITVSATPSGGGSSGGRNTTSPPTFDIQKALDYLKSAQSSDGSFEDSLLYTDWAGIAFGAMNVTGSSHSTLPSYFNSNNETSSLLTDNERHAMALLALGQNPYSFGDDNVNYITAITDSFDGVQFGDADLVNDDIFALIPLKNAGYDENDDIITKDITFIISKQKNNGSWEESVDITAAAIQALKPFNSVADVSDALFKATDYLVNEQNSDGGWGNVSSTSWAMQAMNTLGASWAKNNKTGIDYLGTQQVTDGAVSPSTETLANRIWATSYAIVGASGKSWSEIMESISKPTSQNDNQNGSNNNDSTNAEITEPPFNPETLQLSPVVCPAGDLFSATTGERCIEFVAIDKPLQANLEITTKSKPKTVLSNKEKNLVAYDKVTPSELPINTNTSEIVSDTLTATVINTSPNKTIPKNVYTVFGTLSGLVLLYFISKSKFLIK